MHDWPHDIDFCKRCGRSRMEVMDKDIRECDAPENVRSIIPEIRRKQLDAFVAPLLARIYSKMRSEAAPWEYDGA